MRLESPSGDVHLTCEPALETIELGVYEGWDGVCIYLNRLQAQMLAATLTQWAEAQ